MHGTRHKLTWIKLIENYRKLTLLWDRQHKDYSDQRLREEAFKKLLQIYKTIDSKATLLTFKNKLDIMRTSYNRERKRMNVCKAEGVAYIPNLWYFKHLNFLDNSLEMPEDRESCFQFNKDNNEIYLETSSLKRKLNDNNSSRTPKLQADKDKSGHYRNREPVESSKEEKSQNTPPPLPSQVHIKVKSPYIKNTFSLGNLDRKNSEISPDNRLWDLLIKQENFVGTVSKLLTKEQEDWEVIGKSIGLQLSCLEGKQRTIARKLINDVIFFGGMEQLTVESYIEMMPDNDKKELFNHNIDSSN